MTLSDLEIDKLQIILNDDVLLKVIRKVFLHTIEEHSPQITNEDNTVLGEKYRAYNLSKDILFEGFKKLEEHKKGSSVNKIVNRAR